jgi:hypothetical protein
MPSASGLGASQRLRGRERASQAAILGYHHASQIRYTQGGARWEGIANRCNARRGEFPTHADCSSFVTWCLWNALYLAFNVGDVVNGAGWTAGYTGTMKSHGLRVQHEASLLRADCVHYGPGTGHHVAMVIGRVGGVPMVISHGSESGPHYVRFDYRDDIAEFRRYI